MPSTASSDPSPAGFYDRNDYNPMGSVGLLMRTALGSMRAEVDRRLAPHDLTHAQWMPLFKIASGERISVMELARNMSVDPGAMTRNLSRLEAKGLVTRVRSDEDRRCVRLEVTEAGRQVACEVRGVLADVMNLHLAGFTSEEWDQLISLLQRFIANGEALRQSVAPDHQESST